MVNFLKKLAMKNKFFDNVILLAYRLCCCGLSVLFLLCRIFPVKPNKIVGCNMKGKRYGDNPKYIFDEIIRQGLDYEMIWLMRSDDDKDLPPQVKRVPYNPFSIAYHLSTARFWVDTNLKAVGTLKRKGQVYFQTWHGSYGLKKTGADVAGGQHAMDLYPYKYNAKIIDYMISNSRQTSELVYRGGMLYTGEVLEVGSPRNDIFYEDPLPYNRAVREHFGLSDDTGILLYAPTFRSDYALDSMRVDFERLLAVVERKYQKSFVILVRLHPYNMSEAEEFITYSDKIINASGYNVMQELLVAADILITDYSSSMFDFITKPKPCFCYATDIEDYKGDRDFYMDIFSLPFPVAQNNDELESAIMEFDAASYNDKVKELYQRVGLCDNGKACAQVIALMEELK